MKLQGEKVYLRETKKVDLKAFAKWHARSLKEEEGWFKEVTKPKTLEFLTLFLKRSGRPIGYLWYDTDSTDPDYRGTVALELKLGDPEDDKGYSAEALKMITQSILEGNPDREILITIDTLNQKALKTYEKNGFGIIAKRLKVSSPTQQEYVMRYNPFLLGG